MTTSTHEEILVGGMAIRPRLEPAESDGVIAIHEFDVAAGASLPVPHSHDAYEETIYGIHGTVTFTVEGTPHDIGPGATLFIPRGAIHAFANTGDVDATALAIITPGLLGGDYFREVAAVIDAAGGGPPDPGAIADVMRRHGLTPAIQDPTTGEPAEVTSDDSQMVNRDGQRHCSWRPVPRRSGARRTRDPLRSAISSEI